ncbi:MAG: DNA repair protein RecN [Clostridiales bacterium]|uniref:DNA repair protein RecN n=1 Tax=Hornefia butyriciproducens TaxID=2652293 RepID=UPI002A91B07E|nr:DNA repair protein RecN [Hornefia butyriciproducens]MCI7679836.1 DNA repair protein RecN [Clostridiales bacterium]MDY5463737.1 DNA repair protein RecN [Hornefia butyriciproducens]
MIQHLLIQNFAIIENTEIEFEDGLNIITGETGSGKSIVIEAVSLALGARADSSFVRSGKDKAVIQLAASLDGQDYVITREISATGKNLCRLNGQLVTLGEISALASRIADIHGQYDNQNLRDPRQHLALVDQYRDAEISPLRAEFDAAYAAYKESRGQLDTLLKSEKESRKQADFYRFELAEIQRVDPSPEEDEELTEQIAILQNSEKIFSAVESAYGPLDENEFNVLSLMGNIQSSLESIRNFSREFAETADIFNDAYYGLQDVAARLAGIREQISFRPEELDKLISRLDQIDELKKKYGGSIGDVLAYRDRIQQELSQLENFDELRGTLEQETKQRLRALRTAAAALTGARQASAEALGQAIESELHDLNFDSARFEIRISAAPAISAEGGDEAEILISTNRGEPLKPLIRVASGGEISRIMLAIKNITGTYDKIPTMIFDEIDAGISGITASIVGRKLREISSSHQIICITHLPQIAACGDANYRICKETDANSTYTHVDRLDEEATIDEIARLLGGEIITETTRRSARELISGKK